MIRIRALIAAVFAIALTSGYTSPTCVPLPADGTFQPSVTSYCAPAAHGTWWTWPHIAALSVAAVLAGAFILAWLLSLRTRPAEDPDLADQTNLARAWLADVTHGDDPDFAAMPGDEVRRRVDRIYPGGWEAFAKEMTP